MSKYYPGLFISFLLHLGLILSLTDIFGFKLNYYSLSSPSPIPVFLVEEKPIKQQEVKKNIISVPKNKVIEKEISVPISKEDPGIALEEIKSLMLSNKDSQAESTSFEKVSLYSNLIRNQVMQRWNKPPSAKPGMSVELNIILVPTGEIIDVRINRGSGSEAFDRSALIAVERVGQFEGIQMPRHLFEEYFRNLTLIFNPKE